MKLIELIMKHVPRGYIHPDAKFFAQDSYNGDNRLNQFENMPAANYKGQVGYWFDDSYIACTRIALPELAEDANDTVVTREQLEYLWSLQDQGYTLVFGANPFTNPTGALVEIVPFNFFGPAQTLRTLNVVWKNVIAYRPAHRLSIKNESRPRVEYYEPETTIATVIEANLKGRLAAGVTDVTSFPRLEGEQVCFSLDGRVSANGDNLVIITRKQWDDYISRKIRVGDKVETPPGSIVTVLHVGKKNAFVRYDNGAEIGVSLERLTRIPQ